MAHIKSIETNTAYYGTSAEIKAFATLKKVRELLIAPSHFSIHPSIRPFLYHCQLTLLILLYRSISLCFCSSTRFKLPGIASIVQPKLSIWLIFALMEKAAH